MFCGLEEDEEFVVAFSELELLPALLTEENKIKTNQTKLMAFKHRTMITLKRDISNTDSESKDHAK